METTVGTPLAEFSRGHAVILSHLRALAGARAATLGSMTLFEHAMLARHGDEESELFPAVLRWAEPGAEHDRLEAMVRHSTAEHRRIESLWIKQRCAVAAALHGGFPERRQVATIELLQAYVAHVDYEARNFLPLAREILSRDEDHLMSLKVSLQKRHAPPIPSCL